MTVPKGVNVIGAAARSGSNRPEEAGVSDEELLLDSLEINTQTNVNVEPPQIDEDLLLMQSLDPSYVPEEPQAPVDTGPAEEPVTVQPQVRQDPLKAGLAYDAKKGWVSKESATPDESLKSIQVLMNAHFQAKQREKEPLTEGLDTPVNVSGVYDQEFVESLWQLRQEVVGMDPEAAKFNPLDSGNLFGQSDEDAQRFFETLGNREALDAIKPAGHDWIFHPEELEGAISNIRESLVNSKLAQRGQEGLAPDDPAYAELDKQIGDALNVYRVAGAGNWTHVWKQAADRYEDGTATDLDKLVRGLGPRLFYVGGGPVAEDGTEFSYTAQRVAMEQEIATGKKTAAEVFARHTMDHDPKAGYTAEDEAVQELIDIPGTMFQFNNRSRADVRDQIIEWDKDPKKAARDYTEDLRKSLRPIRNVVLDFPSPKEGPDRARTPERVRAYNLFMYPAALLTDPDLLGAIDDPESRFLGQEPSWEDDKDDVVARAKILNSQKYSSEIREIIEGAVETLPNNRKFKVLVSPADLETPTKERPGETRDETLLYLIALTNVDDSEYAGFGSRSFPKLNEKFTELGELAVEKGLVRSQPDQLYSGDMGGYFHSTFGAWEDAIRAGDDPMEDEALKDRMFKALSSLHDGSAYGQLIRYGTALMDLDDSESLLMEQNQRGQPGIRGNVDDRIKKQYFDVYRKISTLLTSDVSGSIKEVESRFIKDLPLAYDYATAPKGFGSMTPFGQAAEKGVEALGIAFDQILGPHVIAPFKKITTAEAQTMLENERREFLEKWSNPYRKGLIDELAEPYPVGEITAASRAFGTDVEDGAFSSPVADHLGGMMALFNPDEDWEGMTPKGWADFVNWVYSWSGTDQAQLAALEQAVDTLEVPEPLKQDVQERIAEQRKQLIAGYVDRYEWDLVSDRVLESSSMQALYPSLAGLTYDDLPRDARVGEITVEHFEKALVLNPGLEKDGQFMKAMNSLKDGDDSYARRIKLEFFGNAAIDEITNLEALKKAAEFRKEALEKTGAQSFDLITQGLMGAMYDEKYKGGVKYLEESTLGYGMRVVGSGLQAPWLVLGRNIADTLMLYDKPVMYEDASFIDKYLATVQLAHSAFHWAADFIYANEMDDTSGMARAMKTAGLIADIVIPWEGQTLSKAFAPVMIARKGVSAARGAPVGKARAFAAGSSPYLYAKWVNATAASAAEKITDFDYTTAVNHAYKTSTINNMKSGADPISTLSKANREVYKDVIRAAGVDPAVLKQAMKAHREAVLHGKGGLKEALENIYRNPTPEMASVRTDPAYRAVMREIDKAVAQKKMDGAQGDVMKRMFEYQSQLVSRFPLTKVQPGKLVNHLPDGKTPRLSSPTQLVRIDTIGGSKHGIIMDPAGLEQAIPLRQLFVENPKGQLKFPQDFFKAVELRSLDAPAPASLPPGALAAGLELPGSKAVFFSQAERSLAQAWPKGANSIKGQALLKRMLGKGAKNAEIQTMGLDRYLASKERFTFKEVFAYINKERLRVEELVNVSEAKLQSMIEDLNLKLAEAVARRDKALSEQIPGEVDKARNEISRLREQIGDMADRQTRYENYVQDGGRNYREFLIRSSVLGDDVTLGHSGHFSEPGVLFFVQATDRIDAEGNKYLCIETIQSDWHKKFEKLRRVNDEIAKRSGLDTPVERMSARGWYRSYLADAKKIVSVVEKELYAGRSSRAEGAELDSIIDDFVARNTKRTPERHLHAAIVELEQDFFTLREEAVEIEKFAQRLAEERAIDLVDTADMTQGQVLFELLVNGYRGLARILDTMKRSPARETFNRQISDIDFQSPKLNEGIDSVIELLVRDEQLPVPPLQTAKRPKLWEGTAVRFMLQRAARENYDGVALVNADDLAQVVAGFPPAPETLNGLRAAYNPVAPDGRIGRYPSHIKKMVARFGVDLEVANLSKWEQLDPGTELAAMPTYTGSSRVFGTVTEADLKGNVRGIPADVPGSEMLSFMEGKLGSIKIDDGTPEGAGVFLDKRLSTVELEKIASDAMTANRRNILAYSEIGASRTLESEKGMARWYQSKAYDAGEQAYLSHDLKGFQLVPENTVYVILAEMLERAGTVRNMFKVLKDNNYARQILDSMEADKAVRLPDGSLVSSKGLHIEGTEAHKYIHDYFTEAIRLSFEPEIAGRLSASEQSLLAMVGRPLKSFNPKDLWYHRSRRQYGNMLKIAAQLNRPDSPVGAGPFDGPNSLIGPRKMNPGVQALSGTGLYHAYKDAYGVLIGDRRLKPRPESYIQMGYFKEFVNHIGATVGDYSFPATAIKFNKKLRAHLQENPVPLWMERGGKKLGKFEVRNDPKAAPAPAPKLEVSITGMRPEFPELRRHWDDYTATTNEFRKRLKDGEDPASPEMASLRAAADQYLQELYDLYQPFLKKCLTEDLPPGLIRVEAERPGFGVWNGDPSEATVILRFDYDDVPNTPVPEPVMSALESLVAAMQKSDPDLAIRSGSWDVGNFANTIRMVERMNRRQGGLEETGPVSLQSLTKMFDESVQDYPSGWVLIQQINNPRVNKLWKKAKKAVDSLQPATSLARDIIVGRLAQFSKVYQQGGFLFREKASRIGGITPEMIDGSVPFPDNFVYRDAGGVNRAATIVIDTSSNPALQANARPLLDHMADRYMGATHDPEAGTITIAHTPEWSGQTPIQHLESVREYLEAAKVRNLSVDIDAFRENVYVAEPIAPKKFKAGDGSLVSSSVESTPASGLLERIYDYETLILHGLEAEQDASRYLRSSVQRDVGTARLDSGEAAARPAPETGTYPTSRSERTGSKSKRFAELAAQGFRPQHFAGFRPKAKRKFWLDKETRRIAYPPEEPPSVGEFGLASAGKYKSVDEYTAAVEAAKADAASKTVAYREVGRNDYLMNPAKTRADAMFRELEAITEYADVSISDIRSMGRKLGLKKSDWNNAMALLRKVYDKKLKQLPASLRRFDAKAAKELTAKNKQVNVKGLKNDKLIEFAKYYAYQSLKGENHAGIPATMANKATISKAAAESLNKGIAKETNPGNAQKSMRLLDELMEEHPTPLAGKDEWQRFSAGVFGPQDAYWPRPAGLVRFMEPENIRELIGPYDKSSGTGLPKKMLDDTNSGLEITDEFRQAYIDGKMGVVDTGLIFLWGILSRRLSPFPHESLFMDAVLQGPERFIEAAAQGKFDEKMLGPTTEAGPRAATETAAQFRERRQRVLATGDTYAAYMQRVFDDVATYGSPGTQARSNLHDFGRHFLLKMSEPVPSGRFAGQYPLQVIHDSIADFSLSGKEVRRRFVEVKNGKVGIDLKVASFVLLVTGRQDVLVLDRIQVRNLFDNDSMIDVYQNSNVYDGFPLKKAGGMSPYEWEAWGSSQGIGAVLSDTKGLAIYEAMEAALAPSIREAYKGLGREGTLGRFHWESWVVRSNQEVSHGSLGIILNIARGLEDPTAGAITRQGKLTEFMYGVEYVSLGKGDRAFIVRDSTNKPYIMNREKLNEYIQFARKEVPTGYSVTSDTTAWYQYVDAGKRNETIRRLGREATAEEVRLLSDAAHGGRRTAEGDAAIRGQSGDAPGVHGRVSSNGVRQPIDPNTGYVLTINDLDGLGQLRGEAPAPVSHAIYNELGVDVLRDANGAFRNVDESLKIYPLDDLIKGKSYKEVMDMLEQMSKDPDSPMNGWKFKEFGPKFDVEGKPVMAPRAADEPTAKSVLDDYTVEFTERPSGRYLDDGTPVEQGSEFVLYLKDGDQQKGYATFRKEGMLSEALREPGPGIAPDAKAHLQALLDRHGDAPVVRGWNVEIDYSLRRQGIGTALYENMIQRLRQEYPQGAYLVPTDYLGGGTRKEGAFGLWNKLKQRHPSEGEAIYVGAGKQAYEPPNFREFNYNNKHAYIFSPHTGSGHFKDPQYTLLWRATHEIAHGIVDPELTGIYGGQGRRAGSLGMESVEQYAVDPLGKPIEKTHQPLSLAEAFRAVEWEHHAFLKQRQILEYLGVTITDKHFAQEYMVNMVDATHRVLTGRFSNPGELGIDVSNPPTPERMLGRAKHVLARHAKNRNADMNTYLTEAGRTDWDPSVLFMRHKDEVLGMFEQAHSRFVTGVPTPIQSAKFTLTFFRDADFSVFLHENGHLLAEIMGPEWRDGFFKAGWELDQHGLLTQKGHEKAADAFRYYVENRTVANGRLRYYFDSLWTTGIRDLYHRFRNGPGAENLPAEMRDYWDLHLRPDQRNLPDAIELQAQRIADEIPVIRVSDNPVQMKAEGQVVRPQKAKEYLKVNTKREDVLQAIGLKPGDKIAVDEFVGRSLAYMLTEQTRKAFGAGELVALTKRTIVPASRVKRITRDVSDLFAAHAGIPIKAFIEKTAEPMNSRLKLDAAQQRAVRDYAEHIAAEPMGRVPMRLIDPTSDLTYVSFDEMNRLQNSAIDIHAGVAARRDARAEAVAPNLAKAVVHGISNIPDYIAGKWGREDLLNYKEGLKSVFQIQDEFGDYISPGIKEELGAMLREVGETQNWFRRTAEEVRKAGPHKNKVIMKTLDEMRRMLNPPIPVSAGNHIILSDVRNKFKSLRGDQRPTAVPVGIMDLTDPALLSQVRGVFRDGGGYFVDSSGKTFHEVAALKILSNYGQAFRANPLLRLTDQDVMNLADAVDTIIYGLDKRHQLMMDRAVDIAIAMGASKDKNVLLALDDVDKLHIYGKFFSGKWGELDAEFPAIETGIETYKIPQVRRPMLYAELIIRMRAQEAVAKFSETLAQEGLLFTYENMTQKMPVGAAFRDGYMDNVVYVLNQQASAAKSHLLTESGSLLRQGVKKPPEIDYYDPGFNPAQQIHRPHAKQAYIDAMEIMRQFGFKSFKGEWTKTLFPDGSEAVVPQMVANAIAMHLEATADVGQAYGSARSRTYTTRMMDIRSPGQGSGMPPSQAARIGSPKRPTAQVAKMKVADVISTFIGSIPGSGVALNVGLTVGPLIVTPAYFAANFLGGFFQTYQKSGFIGMISGPFASPRITSAVVKRLWGTNSSAPGNYVLVCKDGRVFTADMLAAEATRYGLDSSFIRAETIEGIASELNRTHRSAVDKLSHLPVDFPRSLINFYTEAATASDNYFRVGLFVHELKRGKGTAEAARSAREALFDYGALTELEKKVFRKVILFYSFQRKNMDLFFNTLFTEPHRIAGQVRMMNLLQEELLEENSEIILPPYYKARLVAAFRESVVNHATEEGVATILPMTPIADVLYLFSDMADLSSAMAASVAGEELPGTEFTIAKPATKLLGKLHPYIQACFVLGQDKDLFFGRELSKSYNVVPNWFVELDQNMNGGFFYDLLQIEPHYLQEGKEHYRPVEGGEWQFRARNGRLWYLVRQAHMVPGMGRSMDTVTQLDRANIGLVEYTVRASRLASDVYRDDWGLEHPYPAIREGAGYQLDQSLAQPYSEQLSDTMSPRYGLTETEELLQLFGLKKAFIPTLSSAYDKMAKEAVRTAKKAEAEAKETPDIEEPR